MGWDSADFLRVRVQGLLRSTHGHEFLANVPHSLLAIETDSPQESLASKLILQRTGKVARWGKIKKVPLGAPETKITVASLLLGKTRGPTGNSKHVFNCRLGAIQPIRLRAGYQTPDVQCKLWLRHDDVCRNVDNAHLSIPYIMKFLPIIHTRWPQSKRGRGWGSKNKAAMASSFVPKGREELLLRTPLTFGLAVPTNMYQPRNSTADVSWVYCASYHNWAMTTVYTALYGESFITRGTRNMCTRQRLMQRASPQPVALHA